MSPEPTVGVLPLGEVAEIVPKVIAAHISAYFHLSAVVLAPRPLPAAALDSRRLQYDVGRLLTAMSRLPDSGCDKIIGVVNVDLFVPIFTYVLGEARQGGKYALVSLYRLAADHRVDASENSPFLERAAKVALHEIGHLFELVHCSDPLCLMYFSGGPDDLDQRPLQLCRYCRLFLADSRPRFHP
jgi:archaemetzincin